MPHGGLDDLSFESDGGFGTVAQDEQVLLDVACALPRVADGDEG